jgi:hypothetical protein
MLQVVEAVHIFDQGHTSSSEAGARHPRSKYSVIAL